MPRSKQQQADDPIDLADRERKAVSANFASARAAYNHLERRGYRLLKTHYWLPPASIAAPTHLDIEAAWL